MHHITGHSQITRTEQFRIGDSKDYAYGYDVMMAKKIADKLGCELQIVKLDWDSLIPAVQSGTVDCVIAGQSITSDRKEY